MNLASLGGLIVLGIFMTIGSFLAGNIPLMFHLSQENLNLISTYGAGLLLGAAFLIIIPEGIETVYNNKFQLIRFDDIPTVEFEHDISKRTSINLSKTRTKRHEDEDESFIDSNDIGLSLLFGFGFMFLIDQSSHHDHSWTQQASISVSDLRDHLVSHDSTPAASLGLMIHAAADGIALGAAFIAEESNLQFVIFFAILLHKAPSAFGLSSHLLQKGLPRSRILTQLGLFSLAAPIASIITYCTLGLMNSEDSHLVKYRTGLVLLFSGGTFLYVSTVHILPEIYQKGAYDHVNRPHENHLTIVQIGLFVVGLISPLFLSFGHHH
ncbi:Zinc/iron permease [Globomyces pollinis-pini]|nr:Zinc/iron permease [Globomyces pollinis-pini]